MLNVNGRSLVWSRTKSYTGKKVVIEEEYLKQLPSVKGKKVTNLVRTKHRFNFGSKTKLLINTIRIYSTSYSSYPWSQTTFLVFVSVSVIIIAFTTCSFTLHCDHIFKDLGSMELFSFLAECPIFLKIDDYSIAIPDGKVQSWSLHRRYKPVASSRLCFLLLLSFSGRFL